MKKSIASLNNTPTPVVNAMQEQIAFLESELAETTLRFACAKNSEDHLKAELTRMKSAGTNATSNGYASAANEDATRKLENAHQGDTTLHITVPTADPFLRKKNDARKVPLKRRTSAKRKVLNPGSCASVMNLLGLVQLDSNGSVASFNHAEKTIISPNSRASGLNLLNGLQGNKKDSCKVPLKERTSSKILNPGSCSSAMNLLGFAQLDSNGSMVSLHHVKKKVLNPNSCASGLNLLNGLQGSVMSMSSIVSVSQQLRASQRQRKNASGLSLSSGNNFALIFGNISMMSSSSLARRSSSKNSARLRNKTKCQVSKGNDEWDVFE